jgi:hypothetical protein
VIALERAIEVAEHNGWETADGTLTVWDTLDCPFGTRLEVYPAATAVGGFCATMRDRQGRGFCKGSFDTKLDAATAVLDGYLALVNHGI